MPYCKCAGNANTTIWLPMSVPTRRRLAVHHCSVITLSLSKSSNFCCLIKARHNSSFTVHVVCLILPAGSIDQSSSSGRTATNKMSQHEESQVLSFFSFVSIHVFFTIALLFTVVLGFWLSFYILFHRKSTNHESEKDQYSGYIIISSD